MKRLVGERKALAAAVMAFWGVIWMLIALFGGGGSMVASLAGVYALAFLGLVAGYFWARWFAAGLSMFGLMLGGISLWQFGPEIFVLLLLISHGVAALGLLGDAMSEAYDAQQAWRQRLSMDEHAVNRLGNAVTRLGFSLPLVLIWALGRDSSGLALGAAGLGLLAVAGVVKMRTWGVLAMVGAAGLLVVSVVTAPTLAVHTVGWTPVGAPLAVLAAGLLLAGALPFFGPIRQFLAAR